LRQAQQEYRQFYLQQLVSGRSPEYTAYQMMPLFWLLQFGALAPAF
jgi:hypothetical protein